MMIQPHRMDIAELMCISGLGDVHVEQPPIPFKPAGGTK